MLIARSPLRITLGGGGTDLPSYYREHEGFLVAAAIDRYVYITIHEAFVDQLIVKYSEMERVDHPSELRHPIFREVFDYLGLDGRHIEIASMADIPAGTGLGSSGSFTTALLRALHAHCRHNLLPDELAEQACHIEIDRLGEPIGKQDQYIASYGGLTCFTFGRDGKVAAEPLKLSQEGVEVLEDNLLLFFTGFARRASDLLKDQDDKTKKSDADMVANLHYVKDLGFRSRDALEAEDFAGFAALMHEHWEHKKKRSSGMSNGTIDQLYQFAMANGAQGGKLIGAGGGGFLMFYTEQPGLLRRAMRDKGLREVRFKFDFEGSRIVST